MAQAVLCPVCSGSGEVTPNWDCWDGRTLVKCHGCGGKGYIVIPDEVSNSLQEKMMENGMYFSDRCQFCHEFGEKVEPFLCEDCRQKIFDWLNSKGWTIHQDEALLSRCMK